MMIFRCLLTLRGPRSRIFYHYSTRPPQHDLTKIRNIGVSAHIDAGKTTTTERMLYYSGLIDHMGEVHDGNTVTDYMEQERERGITITSAAVTFYWKNHQFNLIDTPGHIDFTMEVEQTLNVLDGVVVILDSSAGVEAQTLTVWRQADRYSLPRIVYANKMDRPDGSIQRCCEDIEKKFKLPAICLQLPAIEHGKLIGILDVLSLELVEFQAGRDKQLVKTLLTTDSVYHDQAQAARVKLIETLTDFDNDLANQLIASESFNSIPTVDLIKVIRRLTNQRIAVPVVLGSSYKNIGVQSLMDAIILYLPAPDCQIYKAFDDNWCGRAFKVRHDRQKGPLTFVRLYNGTVKRGQKIYSVQRGESEQIGRIYAAYADEYKEVDALNSGNIAVLAGLRKVMSGDFVTTSASAYERAKVKLAKQQLSLRIETTLPQPVFFRSIEPPSMSTQAALEQALNELQREDPSLRVTYNAETGQTVLAGMGELHLDIIKDRILKEYNVEAELGPLQIAYREAPCHSVCDSLEMDAKIANVKNRIVLKLSLKPEEDVKQLLKFDKSPEGASNIAAILPKHLHALQRGIEVGLAHGPKISSQIINCCLTLHWLEVSRGTADSVLTSSASQLVKKLVSQSGTTVLEPVMVLEVAAPSQYASVVMADLSRRRAEINDVTVRGDTRIVTSVVPLAELMGYSTVLRTLSSGTANFTTEFLEYRPMTSSEEMKAIQMVRGF